MHQNQVGYGLSVVPQNRWEDEDGIRYTSRSSVLLRLKASRARIFQSSLKTGRGAAQMVHMASLQKSRGDEAEDGRVDATGYIRLFYPNFVVFIVLCHKGSLVISFTINRTPMPDREASIQPSLSHSLAIVSF
jgi:hypothetical protein